MAVSQLVLLAALLSWSSSALPTCPGSCTCPSPSSLNCSSVGLTQVPQLISDSVTELDLSDNLLGSVTVNRRRHNLRNVWLGNNSITHLSLCVEKNLGGRSVTERRLHHLRPWRRRRCVSWAPTLQLLSAEWNHLEELPEGLQSCESLQVLQLSFNRISVLRSGDLSHLRELKELHLRQNLITSVHPKTFKGLDQLQVLDLSFNMLTTLHPAMFLSLHKPGGDIRLAGNRWRCDCRMRTLRKWMAHDTSLHTWSMVCASPSKLLGKDLRHLKEDDLNCFTTENKPESHQDVKGFHGSEMLLSCYKQADSMAWIPSGEVSVNQPEAGLLIKDVSEKDRGLYVCFSEDGKVVSVFNPQLSKVGGAPRKTRSIPDSNSQMVSPGTHVRTGNERNVRANSCQLALAVCLSILFTFIVAFIFGVLARPCIDRLLQKCCKKKSSTAINTVSTIEQRQYDNMAYVEENGVVGNHRERRITFSTTEAREDNNVQYYDTVAAGDQETIIDEVFKGEEARGRDKAGDSGSESSRSMAEGVTRNSERKHSSSSSVSSLSAKEYNGRQMQDRTRSRSPQMVVDSVQQAATIQATREVRTEDQFDFSDSVESVSPRSSSVLGSFNDSKLVTQRRNDSSSSSSSSHLSDNETTQHSVNVNLKGGVINTGFNQGASFEQQINAVEANRATFVTNQGHPGVGRTHSFSSSSSDSDGEDDKAKQVKDKGVGWVEPSVVRGQQVVKEKVMPMPRTKKSAPLPPAASSSSSSSESDAESKFQQPKAATIPVRQKVLPMPHTKKSAPLPPAASSSSSSSESDAESTFQQPKAATIDVREKVLPIPHTKKSAPLPPAASSSSSSSESDSENTFQQPMAATIDVREKVLPMPHTKKSAPLPPAASSSSSSSESDSENTFQQPKAATIDGREKVLPMPHTKKSAPLPPAASSSSSSSESDSENTFQQPKAATIDGREKVLPMPHTKKSATLPPAASSSSSSSESDAENTFQQPKAATIDVREKVIPMPHTKKSAPLPPAASSSSSSSESDSENTFQQPKAATIDVREKVIPMPHTKKSAPLPPAASSSSSSSESDSENTFQQPKTATIDVREKVLPMPHTKKSAPLPPAASSSSSSSESDAENTFQQPKAATIDVREKVIPMPHTKKSAPLPPAASSSSSSSESDAENTFQQPKTATIDVREKVIPMPHTKKSAPLPPAASSSSSSSESDAENTFQQPKAATIDVREKVIPMPHTKKSAPLPPAASSSSSSSESDVEHTFQQPKTATIDVREKVIPMPHTKKSAPLPPAASSSSSSSESESENTFQQPKTATIDVREKVIPMPRTKRRAPLPSAAHSSSSSSESDVEHTFQQPQTATIAVETQRPSLNVDYTANIKHQTSSSSSDSERERSSHHPVVISRVPGKLPPSKTPPQGSDSSSSSDSEDESANLIQKHEQQMDSARFPIKESLIVPQSQWPVLDLTQSSRLKRRLDFKAKSVGSDSSSSSDSERESSGHQKKEIARVPVTISQPLSHVQASDSSSSSDSEDESSKHIQKHDSARFPIKESLIVPQSQWPVLDLTQSSRLKRRLDFKAKSVGSDSSSSRDSERESSGHQKKEIARVPVTISRPLSQGQASDSSSSSDSEDESSKHIQKHDSPRFPIKESLIVPQSQWPVLDLTQSSRLKRRLDFKAKSVGSDSSSSSDSERESSGHQKKEIARVPVTISQPLSHVQASDSSSSSDSEDESSKHIQKHDSPRFPIKESLIVPQSQWPVLDLTQSSRLKRRLDFKAKSVGSDSSSSSDSERESSGHQKKEIARVPVTTSQPLSHVQASDSSSSSDSEDESSKHIQKHDSPRFPIKESLIVPQSQWPVLDLTQSSRLKRRLDFKAKSVGSDSSSSSDSERESSGHQKKEIARVPVTISQPLSHVQASDSSSSSDSEDESSKHIQKHDSPRFPIKESLIVPQSQWPVLDLTQSSRLKRRLDFKAKSVGSDSSSSSNSERESSGHQKKEIARVPVTISQPLSHVQASDSSSSSDSEDESSKHIQKHDSARFPIKESLIVPQSQWPVLDLTQSSRLKRRLDFKAKSVDINSSPRRDDDNEIENNLKKHNHSKKLPDTKTFWPLLDLQHTSSIKRRLDFKARSSSSSDESDGVFRDSNVESGNKLTHVGVTSPQQGTTQPDLHTRVPLFKPHLNARAPSESEESSSSSSEDENRRERDHVKVKLGATTMTKTADRGFIESPKSPIIKVPLSPKTDYNIKLEKYVKLTDNLVENPTNKNISTTSEISPELQSRWASMNLGVSRFRKRLEITSRPQDPPKVPSSPLPDSPSSSSSESGDEGKSDRSTPENFNKTLHITRETSSSSDSETDVIDSSVPDLSRGVPRIKRRLNVRAPVSERRSSHSSISDSEITKYTVTQSRKETSVPQYRDTDTLITYKRSIFQATSPPSSPPPFRGQSTDEVKRFSEKGPSDSVENRSTSVASKKSNSRSLDDLLNKMVGQKRTTELPPEIRWTGIGRKLPDLPTTSPRSHLGVGLSSAPAEPDLSPSHSSSSSSSSSSESDDDIKLKRGKSNTKMTQKYSFSADTVPSPSTGAFDTLNTSSMATHEILRDISKDKSERRGLSALRVMSSERQQWDVRDSNLGSRALIQVDSYDKDSGTNYHYRRSEEHVLPQSTDLDTDSVYRVPSYRRHGIEIDTSLELAPPPIPATPPPSDEMLGLARRSRPNSWKERSEGTRNYWRMSLNTGDSEVLLDSSKDPITNV